MLNILNLFAKHGYAIPGVGLNDKYFYSTEIHFTDASY